MLFLLSLPLLVLLVSKGAVVYASNLLITEIHYINNGENKIEISGPAGEPTTGCVLEIYDDKGDLTGTIAITATIPDGGSGGGAISVDANAPGLNKNKENGIALVCNSVVIEFLSYIAVVAAKNGQGTAGGTSSDVVGVLETGKSSTQSLQLTDSGWIHMTTSDFGTVNTGLTIAVETTTEVVTTTIEDTTTEPATTSSMTSTPEPDTTSSMTSTPEPDSTPSMTSTPEADTTSSMTSTPEPETTSSMTSTTEPETTSSMDSTTEPETTLSMTSTTEPETTPGTASTTDPETTSSMDSTTDPETTSSMDPTTDPDTTSSMTSTTDPETTSSMTSTKDPETTSNMDSTTGPGTTTDEPTTTGAPNAPTSTSGEETSETPTSVTDEVGSTTEGPDSNSTGTMNNMTSTEEPEQPSYLLITEIHYNNGIGGGGRIEITGPAGESTAGCFVEIYGSNGQSDGTYFLSKTCGTSASARCEIPNEEGGLGAVDLTVDFPKQEFDNTTNTTTFGATGIALVCESAVVEFLSFLGAVNASDGAAAGLISEDIGVSEETVNNNQSLQRNDDGWFHSENSSFGTVNEGLTIVVPTMPAEPEESTTPEEVTRAPPPKPDDDTPSDDDSTTTTEKTLAGCLPLIGSQLEPIADAVEDIPFLGDQLVNIVCKLANILPDKIFPKDVFPKVQPPPVPIGNRRMGEFPLGK